MSIWCNHQLSFWKYLRCMLKPMGKRWVFREFEVFERY